MAAPEPSDRGGFSRMNSAQSQSVCLQRPRCTPRMSTEVNMAEISALQCLNGVTTQRTRNKRSLSEARPSRAFRSKVPYSPQQAREEGECACASSCSSLRTLALRADGGAYRGSHIRISICVTANVYACSPRDCKRVISVAHAYTAGPRLHMTEPRHAALPSR